MDCAADSLLPEWLNEFLMFPRMWLLVGHYIEPQPKWTHVKRNKNKPPFHHRWFGVVLVLVVSDIDGGNRRQHKPDDQEIIIGHCDHDDSQSGWMLEFER